MRSKEVADRVGVSDQTIRDWAGRYKEYLSPGANPEKGAIREYTLEDVRVFATVKRESDRRLPVGEIKTILDGGKLVEEVPEAPTPDDETVPATEHALALQRINVLQRELERTRAAHERELERLVTRLDDSEGKREQTEQQLQDLRERIGQLRAERDQAVRILRDRDPKLAEVLFPEESTDV
jgi:DNA-binding transcriptional MerR regulator